MIGGDYDRLEGSYKIAKIKKLESWSYLLQTIGIIAIFIIMVYLSGGQLKPFYLPLFWPILIAFIWILVVNIETYAFRLMEIRRRDSESAKFLMADRSMKKAYTIIIIAAIVLSVIMIPQVTDQIENSLKIEGERRIDGLGTLKEETVEFVSKGRFALSLPDKIHVDVQVENFSSDSTINVAIISKNYYEQNSTAYILTEEEKGLEEISDSEDSITLDMPEVSFEPYYILFRSHENATIDYEITKKIPNEITYSFSLLSGSFLIANVVGAYLMYPVKRKHSEKAIYE